MNEQKKPTLLPKDYEGAWHPMEGLYAFDDNPIVIGVLVYGDYQYTLVHNLGSNSPMPYAMWVFDHERGDNINYEDGRTQVRFYIPALDGREYVIAKRFANDEGFRDTTLRQYQTMMLIY
jgi:hypothetical protein